MNIKKMEKGTQFLNNRRKAVTKKMKLKKKNEIIA